MHKVANNEVTILERCGSGEGEKTIGRAGVAFDEAVRRRHIKIKLPSHMYNPPCVLCCIAIKRDSSCSVVRNFLDKLTCSGKIPCIKQYI